MFKNTMIKSTAMLFFCLLLSTVTAVAADDTSTWRFPGEFEKQECVYLGWLSKEYAGKYRTDDVMLEAVKELSPHVKVTICAPNNIQKKHIQSLLKKDSVDTKNISFYTIPYSVLYWRDFGPIFTVNDKSEKRIVDFNFNCWGYFSHSNPHSRMMEGIDRAVAKDRGIPSEMTRLTSEGGDRELNGKGTLLVTEACEFQRNPNLSKKDIEDEFKRTLGATNIIWLKRGTIEDEACNTSTLPGPEGKGVAYRSGSANNHIDEFCRFVSPDTILLAEVTQEEAAKGYLEQENRKRLEESYEILKKAVDQDGNPFKIIRIPMPETLYFEISPGDEAYTTLASYPKFQDGTVFPFGSPITVIPAQSYCNFLISNGIVLAQKYWHEGLPHSVKERDEEALSVLKKVFPNRKVVAINTLAINFGGGGIHCSTQQEPYTEKKL